MPVPDWHHALAAAQFAAARGLQSFPLARSKRPAIPSPHPRDPHCRGACGRLGHGVHDATTDPERLRELFEAAPWATAYGIACGRPPHHLIGLDLDVKHGADGPGNLRNLATRHQFHIPA
ncbi:bifunctional DNA primase/polymerase, partial [Kitasatospora sp. MBT63]|uniref:bifunctional DNA primase/polymerase n=1 Tax=Kitasatospora sp. MBT63 TaxID=1444768 RepID=UPI000539875D